MSTHQHIATKFHRLMEGVCVHGNQLDAGDHALIGRMVAAPKYCMSDDVLALAAGEAAFASVEALFRAGLGNRLPHPQLVVEVPHSNANEDGVLFILFEEHRSERMGHDDTYGKEINSDFRASVIDLNFDAIPAEIGRGDILLLAEGTFLIHAGTPERPSLLTGYKPGDPSDPGDVDHIRLLLDVTKSALKALLVAMCTDGIERRVVEAASALNKARLKRGKAAIPDHTILHLSHYLDRDGRRHATTGRHVRLHLRAGHIRQQPCGPRSRDRRATFIKPCLVNYRPGQEAPVPVRAVRP